MKTTVEELPSGRGVRIVVSDDATDTLAILEVKHYDDFVSAKLGLRGNTDAHERPVKWHHHFIPARIISREELSARKQAYYVRARRNGWIR